MLQTPFTELSRPSGVIDRTIKGKTRGVIISKKLSKSSGFRNAVNRRINNQQIDIKAASDWMKWNNRKSRETDEALKIEGNVKLKYHTEIFKTKYYSGNIEKL